MKTERKRARPIDTRRMLSTRRGIMTVATAAAVLAGAILLVFLNAYRDGLTGGGKSETVLVAKQLIAKGAPAEVIAAEGMYQSASLDQNEVEDDAISDPDAIKDQYAARSIFPGEQLRPEDFTSNTDGFSSRVAGYERAMAVPVDNHHGLIGELRAGDHVDVIGAYLLTSGSALVTSSVTKTLLQDVLVLKAPEEREEGLADEQEVYLKIPSDRDAEVIAYSAEIGKIWLTLRPAAGAKSHSPAIGTVQRALFGAQAQPVTQAELRKALRGQ